MGLDDGCPSAVDTTMLRAEVTPHMMDGLPRFQPSQSVPVDTTDVGLPNFTGFRDTVPSEQGARMRHAPATKVSWHSITI